MYAKNISYKKRYNSIFSIFSANCSLIDFHFPWKTIKPIIVIIIIIKIINFAFFFFFKFHIKCKYKCTREISFVCSCFPCLLQNLYQNVSKTRNNFFLLIKLLIITWYFSFSYRNSNKNIPLKKKKESLISYIYLQKNIHPYILCLKKYPKIIIFSYNNFQNMNLESLCKHCT